MTPIESAYRSELLAELERVPPEYLAPLLKILRAFRESITLPTATESFKQGWKEAMEGDIHPIDELWLDLEAENSRQI